MKHPTFPNMSYLHHHKEFDHGVIDANISDQVYSDCYLITDDSMKRSVMDIRYGGPHGMWIIDKLRNKASTKFVIRATFKVLLENDKYKTLYIEGDYSGYAKMDVNEVFEELWQMDERKLKNKQEKYMKLISAYEKDWVVLTTSPANRARTC